MPAPRWRPARVGGCLSAVVEHAADGSVRLRSTETLDEGPERFTEYLARWAREAPDRVLAAQRDARGAWRGVTYAQMRERARAVGQALTDRGLSAGRPVAILSGNDLEHLTLALGALWAGIPHAPLSPAWSLLSRDFGRLKHAVGRITPGLVFAARPEPYAGAIAAIAGPDVEIVLGAGELPDRATTPFNALLAARPGPALDAAHARITPDTIVKFLFTSGSTREPKAVVNTHRMLCTNQRMIRQSFAFLDKEPPVLVDWLPWNHTFGGNHNLGLVLANGGTLYIDDGRPTPEGMAATVRNLREIAPTVYFNVPKGFEELAAAMDHDDALRESLFRRVRAFFFAGAGLSQAVWDRIDRHAERTAGERIQIMTGLGMTETAPACVFALRPDAGSGHIGLPCPGVEVKLVPAGDKHELRFRGPNVMPGYWRDPALTAEAFDDEGFYRTGDAARFVDPDVPQRGLLFDGRIAEDFKLSTGTFVSVGPLRARAIVAGSPLVQDVVVTGADRDEVGLLVFPRLADCRRHAGLGDDARVGTVLEHPAVRGFFQDLLDQLWRAGTGSASRVARLLVMADPPSADLGEITDKGSLNQSAVLRHRAALVARLHATGSADEAVLRPGIPPD